MMPIHKDPATTNQQLRDKIDSLQTERAELVLSLRKTLESKKPNSEPTKTGKGKGKERIVSPPTTEAESLDQTESKDTTAIDIAAEAETVYKGDSTSGEQNDAKETLEAANKIVKRHIALLHSYNEIRDVGQGLLGMIAEARGARVVDLYNEFGLDDKD